MLRRLAALSGMLLCAPALAQMQPGEWEFTSTSTSRLLPAPQVVRVTRCIRTADAENPDRWMSDPGQLDCKLTPGSRTAGSYTWRLECPKVNMRGTGSARMAGERFEGEQQMNGEAQGRKFQLLTKVTGRRVGPCKN